MEALFERLALDRRHARVKKVIVEAIMERGFGAWSMGYPRMSARDLARIPGLDDFFWRGRSYLDLEEGRARTLLAAFKAGQWRASIS